MKRRIMAILLVLTMLFSMVEPSIFGQSITVQAEETSLPTPGFVSGTTPPEDPSTPDYYNVVTVADLKLISDECEKGTERYLKAHYVLWNDIVLTEEHNNEINIGTTTHYFTGTFDGKGHSITGLYSDGQVNVNMGLFGVMKNATVKNLVIKEADIRSNQYGGILAAQVEDSIIQNVTIIDSKCAIDSLGSVVGLITTGGLYGGALVGYAGNTKIYNCESRNTQVYIDTTAGIQAIGGDGMYMGGLVGWMEKGSTLEYSRVIGGDNGKVEADYVVSIGAVSGNVLYAGGIVGRLDGSDTAETQVLDCFSNTYVNYNAGMAISILAGTIGYSAGIVARISGDNYQVERCHYAGKLSGTLYNNILGAIPIPEYDKYLAGIAGNVSDSSNIKNCFFDWEKAIQDNDDPDVPAIYGESDRNNVKNIGDSQYNNPTFFLEFDFNGTQPRSTGNNELFITDANPTGIHYNKWIVDETANMPIHDQEMIIEPVTVYSNINDNSAVIPMIAEDDSLTFPNVEILSEDMLENLPQGISNESVEAQFVGYSLVAINGETHTSCGLYAAGDAIDKATLQDYLGSTTGTTYRIYAVWAQIQTIPGERIYLDDEYNHGLLTVAAVNTKILKNAGLQEVEANQTAGKASYGRFFEYIKDGKKDYPIIGDCGVEIWDNDLYGKYFNKEALPQNWNIVASILSNLKAKYYKDELSVQPYLNFTYTDSSEKRIDGNALMYSHDAGARIMLDENKAGTWLWELNVEEKEELAKYAGYSSYDEYLKDTTLETEILEKNEN